MERDTAKSDLLSKLRGYTPIFTVDADRIDTSIEGRRRQVQAGRITGLAWLVILVSRVFDLFQGNHSNTYVFLGTASLLAFVAIYVYGFFRTFFQPITTWKTWAVVILLAALASAMSLSMDATQLITMIFVVTAASCSLPEAIAARVLAVITVLAGVIAAMTGASASEIASLLFQLVLIGIALIFLRRLIRTNTELRIAREEIARLAVSEERLRFARDLHDLLGHSLSLIALKSELAGRLIVDDPQRVATEVNDIENVSREALRQVRDAVSGYRQPTLDTELTGARAALDAAGIECVIVSQVDHLPSGVESTLGWVVREGVTNVVRHSGARHCHIEVKCSADNVVLTITDDGHGAPMTDSVTLRRSGSGLAGLRERLVGEGGELSLAGTSGAGFRLLARIPTTGRPTSDSAQRSDASRARIRIESPI